VTTGFAIGVARELVVMIVTEKRVVLFPQPELASIGLCTEANSQYGW
jgi:hypothetical protein